MLLKKYCYIIIFIVISAHLCANDLETKPLRAAEQIKKNRQSLIYAYREKINPQPVPQSFSKNPSADTDAALQIKAKMKEIFPYSMDFKPRRVFLEKKQKAVLLYWTGLYVPKSVDKTLNRLRNKETINWESENKIRLPFEPSDYSFKENKSEKLFLPPLEYTDFQANADGEWKKFEDEEVREVLKNAIISGSRFNIIPENKLLKWRARQILKFWQTVELVPPEMKYDLLRKKYEEQLDERRELGLEVSDDRQEELMKLSEDSLFAEEESRRVARKRILKDETLKNFNSKAGQNLIELLANSLSRKWNEKQNY